LAKARHFAEKAEAENRALTAEEQKAYDEIMAKGREVSDAVKAHSHDQEVFAFARELSDNVIGDLGGDLSAAAPTSWRSSTTTPPTAPPRPSTDAWKRCAATPSDSETSSTTEGAHRCTAAHSTHSSMHSELRRAGNASVRRHRAGCRRGDQPYEAANTKPLTASGEKSLY
jgi:hypothetical protein